MGGVTKSIGQGLGDVVTLGTDRISGSPMQTLGNTIGNLGTLGTSGQKGLIPTWGPNAGGNANGSLNAPQIGGYSSPLDTLTQTGGAPLLMDTALGISPYQSVMSYFGASGDYNNWIQSLSPSDRNAVASVTDQLANIQGQVDTQNNLVSQLTKDYPNIMTQKIQQYQNVADPSIQKMMGQAMQQLNAQQAAGGSISSGAAVQAAANVGAQYAGQELSYATNLAQQDFNQQLSQATSMQQFQQKMLGQGAQNGFNAIQDTLNRNQQLNLAQAEYNNKANMYNTQQQNQMYGALGGLAGTVLGGALGGPLGAGIGGTLGSTFGGSPGAGTFQPRLNFGGTQNGYGSQYGVGSPNPNTAFGGF